MTAAATEVASEAERPAFRPHLVPVEPDAAEWCRTFWQQMYNRLCRQALAHERLAAASTGRAAGLSLWATRDFPWAHPARTAARLEAIEHRGAGAACREGASYARGVQAELSRGLEPLASGTDRWEDDGGSIGPHPAEAFCIEPEILELARTAPERSGEWKLGARLPLEGLMEIRIPDAGRMAVRRADLGFPPVYELAEAGIADGTEAGRHSRFFQLDASGDWPRLLETTEATHAVLATRNAARRSAVIAAGSARQATLATAASMEPLDYLRDKVDPQGGGKLVVGFRRQGNSGSDRFNTIDSRGERGNPKGEVRSWLQLLFAAHRIDAGQLAAGEVFAERFADAQFNLGKGTDYSKLRGSSGAAEQDVSTAVEEQRRWVFGFLDALGGGASPIAMAVWFIVGAQMPLDTFAVSRHFRMPGGQRWLTVAEAEGMLVQGLAALRAHLDAPGIEYQNRRHGLKVRVCGGLDVAFLVESRRFEILGRYEPGLKSWVADCMAPRKKPELGQSTKFRHWTVRAASLAGLIETAIATAEQYMKSMRKEGQPAPTARHAGNLEIRSENLESTKLDFADPYGLT